MSLAPRGGDPGDGQVGEGGDDKDGGVDGGHG